MAVLQAFAALLSLQLMGEALVRAMDWALPGPVLGMALLVAVLMARPGWAGHIKPASQGLLQHLSLLFVPAGVGVMLHLQRIGDEAAAIGLALVLSTWIGMAVAALVTTALMRTRPGSDHDT